MALLRNKSLRVVLSLALLVVMPLYAAPKNMQRSNRKQDQKIIQEFEEQWSKALLARDVAALGKLMGEDFLSISATGVLSDKAQYLDHVRSGSLQFVSMENKESKIRVMGDVAIVNSLVRVDASASGSEFRGMYRYTRVYRRLPGVGWKAVNFEATRVSATGNESDMRNGIPIPAKKK